jgi:tetratricopeptide (TPR) repeat protein
MTVVSPIQKAQRRLAGHYLNKLRAASVMLQRGRESSTRFGLSVLDQEWAQIKEWQFWAAQHRSSDAECLTLTKEFPLAGFEALVIRQTALERTGWLKTALEAVRETGDTGTECLILFRLIRECINLSTLDEAEVYLQKLSELAHAANDRLNIGRALYAQGDIRREQGMTREAQSCFQESLKIFEIFNDPLLISRSLWGLGVIARRLGQYQESYEYYQRQLTIVESVGRLDEICTALNAVANGLTALDDYAAAEVYARRCVTLSRSLGYQPALIASLFVVGECELEQNQFEKGLKPFEEAVQAARAIGYHRATIHGLYCLGYSHFRLGHPAQALSCLQQSLDLARHFNLPPMIETLQETIAILYLSEGDPTSARPALHEALMLAQRHDNHSDKVRTIMAAAMLWELEGFPEQAAQWAGLLSDSTNIEHVVFDPVLAKLEAELGKESYCAALEKGKMLVLDEVVAAVIRLLEQGQPKLTIMN